MSGQSVTYENVLSLIREGAAEFDRRMAESDRRMAEADRRMEARKAEFEREMKEIRERNAELDREAKERKAELDRQMKETDRKIAALGSRIGEIVEHMIQGNIVNKFQTLGYQITQYGRNVFFQNPELKISGEIDLFLNDGNTDILIEVKTTLEIPDVHEHIERLEKYRRYFDAKEDGRQRRFVGAVAGAVVRDNAKQFAHKNGMYVITQSDEAVEILTLPENFKVKEW